MLRDNRGQFYNGHKDTDNDLALFLDAVAQLQKIGKELHKRYEAVCNGEEGYPEIDTENLQKKADAIAANVGLYVYHQTDPRGWPLRVSYLPIADNAYDKAAAIDCHLEDDYDGPTTE